MRLARNGVWRLHRDDKAIGGVAARRRAIERLI
jgi:hypothetical protein